MEERIYTISLKDAYSASRPYRARKAINLLKRYLKRHLKTEEFSIGPGLNHEIWSRGMKKPPKRVKVVVTKEGEKFKVELFGYKPKKKEEKKESKPEVKKEEKKTEVEAKEAKPEEKKEQEVKEGETKPKEKKEKGEE